MYTVEFGLCKQEDELKVFGAGLLSSLKEFKVQMYKEYLFLITVYMASIIQ